MTTQAKQRSKLLAELLAGIEAIAGYDCLAQKSLGQEGLRQELSRLGPDEIRAYWRRRHAELLALQAKMREKPKQ